MKALPFEVVAAFLRIGQKYSIEILKAEAASRLTYEYPSSPDAWNSLVEYSMIERNECLDVDTINFTHETQCSARITPMAFCNLFMARPIHEILT